MVDGFVKDAALLSKTRICFSFGQQQEGTNACSGQGYKVPEQCPVPVKVLFLSSTLVLNPCETPSQKTPTLRIQPTFLATFPCLQLVEGSLQW